MPRCSRHCCKGLSVKYARISSLSPANLLQGRTGRHQSVRLAAAVPEAGSHLRRTVDMPTLVMPPSPPPSHY